MTTETYLGEINDKQRTAVGNRKSPAKTMGLIIFKYTVLR